MTRNVRVVMAKLGLDIHWRGVYLVAQFLKDAGMEVVFLGNQFPEQIVEAALEEDADIVGLSSLSGNHMTLAPKVVRLLRDIGPRTIVRTTGDSSSATTAVGRWRGSPLIA